MSALIRQTQRLPRELYKSLTWDRGKELADHPRLSLATDVEYQAPLILTHEGDFEGGEFLNLWLPVGGHGHGCSDRIAGRL